MSGVTRAVTSTVVTTNSQASPATASARWDAFRRDPRERDFHLDGDVVRDAALDISAILRPVQVILVHPLDQLAMAAVPGQMEVCFETSHPLLYQSDERDIALVPSQEEFLGWHGLLPSIEVHRCDDGPDGVVAWRVAAPGEDASVRFLFEAGAAPLAKASLGSLEKAARLRHEAFEQMVSELQRGADVGMWGNVRRTAASNFWKDLPERVRQRVLAYFCSDARAAALVSGADIGAALRDGASGPLPAVAGELLLAGLLYWQQRCVASLVPVCFWDSEIVRAVPFNAGGADFAAALHATLDAYTCWMPTRLFYRDLLRDMDRSALGADARYLHQRARLMRALLRAGGQRVSKAGGVVRDLLDGLDPAQLRQRMAAAIPALEADMAQPGTLVFHARLAQALDRMIAPRPVVLGESDHVDEAAMLRDSVSGGDGVSLLAYVLAPDLPAARVASVLAWRQDLLPSGELPLQVMCQDDGTAGGACAGPDPDSDSDSASSAGWRRCYRLAAPRRFDDASQSWLGVDCEVSVAGSVLCQRQALDRHMAMLIEALAQRQQDHFRRCDRASITIDGQANVLLAPVSRFSRRQVCFTGCGRLVLPAQLRGSVQLDCAGLAPEAAAPLLQLDPILAAGLQRVETVLYGGQQLAVWRGAGCTLLVSNDDTDCCAQSLALQADIHARRRLREDMANPALAQVEVSTAITGDIELLPSGRDLVLLARPCRQRFVVRHLGCSSTRLRVQSAGDDMPFALQLDLRACMLPRYTVSVLQGNAILGWSGQIIDAMSGGRLRLEVAAGVRFDQASWEQARCEAAALRAQALADAERWETQLSRSTALDAGQFSEFQAVAAQLAVPADRLWAQQAAMLHAQWNEESPQVLAGEGGDPAVERLAQARQVLCRMVAYLCREKLRGLDDAQWQRYLCDTRQRIFSLPLQRVLNVPDLQDLGLRQDLLVFGDAMLSMPGLRACRGRDSILVFAGRLDTVCQHWTWQACRAGRMQVDLAFQLLPGRGWLLRPPRRGHGCMQATVRDAASSEHIPAETWHGVGEHLDAALLAIKGAGLRGCAQGPVPPWMDDEGAGRTDLPLCTLSDPAGNRYLLLGEAAASLRQWQQGQGGEQEMGGISLTARLTAAGSLSSSGLAPDGEVLLLPEDVLKQVFGPGATTGSDEISCAGVAQRLRAAVNDMTDAG